MHCSDCIEQLGRTAARQSTGQYVMNRRVENYTDLYHAHSKRFLVILHCFGLVFIADIQQLLKYRTHINRSFCVFSFIIHRVVQKIKRNLIFKETDLHLDRSVDPPIG
jgi:Tat protein secretion system quality control protein TatD with DNase activity